MRHFILRPILVGAAAGGLLFLFSFVFKFLLFALAIGLLIRFAAKRWRPDHAPRFQGFRPHWADKIRSMTDDEYQDFKQQLYPIPTL